MKRVLLRAAASLLVGSVGLTAAVQSLAADAAPAEAGTEAVTQEMTTLVPTAEVGATLPAVPEEPGVTFPAVSAEDKNSDGKITAADVRAVLLEEIGADGTASSETILKAKRALRSVSAASDGAQSVLGDISVGIYDRAILTNGKGYSAAEYSYYYSSIFSGYYQRAYYYDRSYGEGAGKMMTGFDYAVSPSAQYTKDEDGNRITFAQLFHETAISTLESIAYYCGLAEQEGYALDADDETYISESIDSAKSTAMQYGMTIDSFIEMQFGEGVNEYVLTKIMRDRLLAGKYQDGVLEKAKKAVTDEEIEAKFNEDKDRYMTVYGRMLRLSIKENEDGTSDVEAQRKKAEELVGKIKTDEDFIAAAAELDPVTFADPESSRIDGIDRSTLEQYLSKEAADWCFDGSRKAGDIESFDTERYIYVIYLDGPASRSDDLLPTVRHLLVKYDEEPADEDGVTAMYEEERRSKDEAKRLAEKYLAEYKKGKKTEESFAALADEYSDDVSSTKNGGGEGGLYADIERGRLVQPFEDWSFDPARKPGDVGIVETKYGYHVMYFVSRSEEPAWKAEIRDSIGKENAEKQLAETEAAMTEKAVYLDELIDAADRYTLGVIESMM